MWNLLGLERVKSWFCRRPEFPSFEASDCTACIELLENRLLLTMNTPIDLGLTNLGNGYFELDWQGSRKGDIRQQKR
jgi:hypothetical protein